MRLRFTAGERERRPSRGQTKNARCCCCCCYSLALFSPSKSFGAVERGGGRRRQKARDETFSFWIESIAFRLSSPKDALRRKGRIIKKSSSSSHHRFCRRDDAVSRSSRRRRQKHLSSSSLGIILTRVLLFVVFFEAFVPQKNVLSKRGFPKKTKP